jgi:hypothetical protein
LQVGRFAEIPYEDIARRAYEIYRGRVDATDVDDWFQAERELRARRDVRG